MLVEKSTIRLNVLQTQWLGIVYFIVPWKLVVNEMHNLVFKES
jgi:hypothetical protein